jgi:hypothetical protein
MLALVVPVMILLVALWRRSGVLAAILLLVLFIMSV